MKIKEMITELGNRFGQSNVIVRSEYHTQIITTGKPHDIWFSTKEGLKWRLAGMQQTQGGPPERLLGALDKWAEKDTDFGKMQSALELSAQIGRITLIAAQRKITRAAFCDAGYKNGLARIGIVMIDGDDVDAIRRNFKAGEVQDIHQAEVIAIETAIKMADELDPNMTIYSDSQTAIQRLGLARVQWIPRGQNKHADGMANMRG